MGKPPSGEFTILFLPTEEDSIALGALIGLRRLLVADREIGGGAFPMVVPGRTSPAESARYRCPRFQPPFSHSLIGLSYERPDARLQQWISTRHSRGRFGSKTVMLLT